MVENLYIGNNPKGSTELIKKFNANPDSNSGIVTVPKVIGAGESVTIPAGRVAVLPNVQVDGTLNIEGEVFIPTGSMTSQVVQKVTSTDNAVVRFDGTTGQVQNSAITIDDSGNIGSGTQSFNGFGGSGFKNVIINGKFNVNQYGRLPYVAQASAECYIDCWKAANSGTGILTLSEDSITYSGKVFKAMKATATTAITLGANTRYFAFATNLEANNVSSISTDNMTLSFLFECSRAGKYSVALAKADTSSTKKSYTTSFTATVGVQQVIISIPADSYKVLDGINTGFILHVGFVGNTSLIITSVDGWQSLGTFAWMKSDALSWGDTVGAYIKIADVNLEPGLSKSPSENRPYGLELSLCQRYFEVGSMYIIGNTILNGYVGGTISFNTEKRVIPTIIPNNVFENSGNNVGFQINHSSRNAFRLYTSNTTNHTQVVMSSNYYASAEL